MGETANLMGQKIDLNRGVTIRFGPGGIRIYMYKDSPGYFFNEYEVAVSEKIAKSAGFDIEKLGKMRTMMERKAAAMEAIDEEFGDLDPSAFDGAGKVVYEIGDFSVVHTGFGKCFIQDPEGNKMGDQWLTKEQAKHIARRLAVGEDDTVESEEAETAKAA